MEDTLLSHGYQGTHYLLMFRRAPMWKIAAVLGSLPLAALVGVTIDQTCAFAELFAVQRYLIAGFF